MHALVFAGGEAVDARWHQALPRALVVAADSGLDHAHALGIHADLVVGDLDSVSTRALARARAEGTRVEEHPADKDATDLELALAAARAAGAGEVTVVGVGGGRLDHLLANALLLTSPAWGDLKIRALAGPALLTVIRRAAELRGGPGSLVTLLAAGGRARGVRTDGLRWALHGEDLDEGSTRGVSNEMTGREAHVALSEGVLLAVQPDGGG